jgi:lysyl-tRNA synthetase class 2
MTVTLTRKASRYSWVPAAAGWTVGVIATLSLIASVSPGIRWLIKEPREFVNDYIFNFPDTSFAWAFVLVLLAAALAARKRIAWWILIGYMLASIAWNVGGLVTSPKSVMDDIGEVIGLAFHISSILFLLLARKEFWAKVRRGALVKAAATLVTGMAIGTLVGWALLEVFPGSLAREDRFLYALNRVSAFAGADPDSFSGHPHVFVNALLGLFGAVALMVAAIVLFQSQRAENALTGEDESAIRGLLELFGKNDSLGYFATRRDKAVVFAQRPSRDHLPGRSRCLPGQWRPRRRPEGVAAGHSRMAGAVPNVRLGAGVMGASLTGAEAFRQAGLNALQLGDEAILHPDNFRLSGPDMRAVRQAVTRARRAGATVRIRRHRDLSSDEMARVVERADAWRDTETERGFSMALGRVGDPADGDCLLVEAVQSAAGNDQVVAMLSLVPWGNNGVSLDLMRRSPQSPNGTIELMVSELCMQSEGIGVTRISLNFAMFRTAFEQGAQLGAGPVARLWRGLLVFFSRWWQLETLYRSNMKYQPEWVPRYACYEDARLVPRVGVASVIAEGFLVLPFSRRNPQPHTGQHISAPENLVATGLLHPDGSAPDLSGLQADLPEADAARLPEQVRVRMAKLKSLQADGLDAYPVGEAPSHTVAQAVDASDDTDVTVAGRILRIRDYGGVLFADLRDWSGEVQLLLGNSLLEKGTTADFTHAIDLGDLIEVSGSMGRSKSGTQSLLVHAWRLIGKCLRPLPDKWKGLTDQEARVRARYVDLAINTEARDLIRARSGVLHSIPPWSARGFGGRDTDPAAIHGGNARPFSLISTPTTRPVPRIARAVPQAALRRRCRAGFRGRAFRNGRRLQSQPGISHCRRPTRRMPTTTCGSTGAASGTGRQRWHVFLRPRDGGVPNHRHLRWWTVKSVHGAVSGAGRTDRPRH